MAKLTIRLLVWDDWNKKHIARHDVTPQEVEQTIEGKAYIRDSYKERYVLTGTTEDMRVLTVVLGERKKNVYYVITARPASRKERRQYKAFLEGESDDSE